MQKATGQGHVAMLGPSWPKTFGGRFEPGLRQANRQIKPPATLHRTLTKRLVGTNANGHIDHRRRIAGHNLGAEWAQSKTPTFWVGVYSGSVPHISELFDGCKGRI